MRNSIVDALIKLHPQKILQTISYFSSSLSSSSSLLLLIKILHPLGCIFNPKGMANYQHQLVEFAAFLVAINVVSSKHHPYKSALSSFISTQVVSVVSPSILPMAREGARVAVADDGDTIYIYFYIRYISTYIYTFELNGILKKCHDVLIEAIWFIIILGNKTKEWTRAPFAHSVFLFSGFLSSCTFCWVKTICLGKAPMCKHPWSANRNVKKSVGVVPWMHSDSWICWALWSWLLFFGVFLGGSWCFRKCLPIGSHQCCIRFCCNFSFWKIDKSHADVAGAQFLQHDISCSHPWFRRNGKICIQHRLVKLRCHRPQIASCSTLWPKPVTCRKGLKRLWAGFEVKLLQIGDGDLADYLYSKVFFI